MHTFYKVAITITCLISLFFFGKWINKVYPRYEWKERIEQINGSMHYFNYSSKIFCNQGELEKYTGLQEVILWDGEGALCYVKEKVRIN